MTRKTGSTRRAFITIAGAALSAPMAAAAATLPGRVGNDPLKTRLERLEDVNAIRALNHLYLQHAAAGAHEEMAALFADPANRTADADVRRLSPADFGEHDVIDVAEDRHTATARLHVTVHTETALDPDCTLVQMAREQGGGVIVSAEAAVFENGYVRLDGVWKIESVRVTPGGLSPVHSRV